MKDPADPKRHMVPDPETAPVVRYIFDLCVSGKGPAQIAKQLKKDKIPTPGYSYYQKHGVELTGVDITQPYNWSTNTVAGILEDETYLGHTINLKSTTLSFKNKKRIERPESEQLRFENTHEALISRQTWEIVQDIRKHKRRRANMAEQNIFSGLVYCLDCGGTMVLHRAHTMDAVKNNFMCSTYKKKVRRSAPVITSGNRSSVPSCWMISAVLRTSLVRMSCGLRSISARSRARRRSRRLQCSGRRSTPCRSARLS